MPVGAASRVGVVLVDGSSCEHSAEPWATRTQNVDARAFAFWDDRVRALRVAAGCDVISLGPSSRDLPLTGTQVL